MSIFALILGALSGSIIPLVQSDNAETAAELTGLDEAEIFDAHYWGGWFHDWTLVYLVAIMVALIMWANDPRHFRWVMFAATATLAHMAAAYAMSWVVWLADGVANYLGLNGGE